MRKKIKKTCLKRKAECDKREKKEEKLGCGDIGNDEEEEEQKMSGVQWNVILAVTY